MTHMVTYTEDRKALHVLPCFTQNARISKQGEAYLESKITELEVNYKKM